MKTKTNSKKAFCINDVSIIKKLHPILHCYFDNDGEDIQGNCKLLLAEDLNRDETKIITDAKCKLVDVILVEDYDEDNPPEGDYCAWSESDVALIVKREEKWN